MSLDDWKSGDLLESVRDSIPGYNPTITVLVNSGKTIFIRTEFDASVIEEVLGYGVVESRYRRKK